ncbi:hypothetical protein [Brevifollis gellanilyticus]|uniref:Uncharacterized protein n=1 Tax=Brevifollis gellanilyticus TaxID=748831 RepID=A0A512MAF0_9BACT|nr:hypothetical protein [Brevifollis gellanilyticus]GEP43710.1 hypothetical protein BGE01nite_30010 [Brevifollis gellanilyticus]
MPEDSQNSKPNGAAQPSPEELIARMDALLAKGREAMDRVDQFYTETGLVQGIGAKTLLGDEVPEEDRVIFARLLTELEIMEQRIAQIETAITPVARVSVSARAVGNRYRI